MNECMHTNESTMRKIVCVTLANLCLFSFTHNNKVERRVIQRFTVIVT